VTDNLWTRALVPESRYLFVADKSRVRLEVVGGTAQGDMSLLRTIGSTEELPVFPGRIGMPPGGSEAGMHVFTSGFPSEWNGRQVANTGAIRGSVRHDLGIPHQDLVLDFPVRHGQSGSPVVVESDGEVWLIGLVHATENGKTWVVPFDLWAGTLHTALDARAQR